MKQYQANDFIVSDIKAQDVLNRLFERQNSEKSSEEKPIWKQNIEDQGVQNE